MAPVFKNLVIENFRGLKRLRLEGLGRVNLVTGRNNTGKSTVLEASRLLAARGALSVVRQIMRDREELANEDYARSSTDDLDPNVNVISQIFHGYPGLSGQAPLLRIATSGSERASVLEIGLDLIEITSAVDGYRRIRQGRFVEFDEQVGPEASPVLVVRNNSDERFVPLKFVLRGDPTYREYRVAEIPTTIRCQYSSAYSGQRTDTLAALWDEIALSDREDDVVEALRIIEPRISAVSMIGASSESRGKRLAVVRAEGFSRPVPLRSFGDGLNRLFGIALSLVTAANGLWLIDEFENGMHYSVLCDVWRTIFALSRKLDVQVIATTHSWDVIEAFQRAASEDPDEGVLIRLTRRGDDVIPTIYTENELAIVTRDRIEVR